jgi:hypothetical protein
VPHEVIREPTQPEHKERDEIGSEIFLRLCRLGTQLSAPWERREAEFMWESFVFVLVHRNIDAREYKFPKK